MSACIGGHRVCLMFLYLACTALSLVTIILSADSNDILVYFPAAEILYDLMPFVYIKFC